jgi:hypothetical protein
MDPDPQWKCGSGSRWAKIVFKKEKSEELYCFELKYVLFESCRLFMLLGLFFNCKTFQCTVTIDSIPLMRIRIDLNAETNADPLHWFEYRWRFLCLPKVSLQCLGSGSACFGPPGSFYHQAKRVRKTSIVTVLRLLYDLMSRIHNTVSLSILWVAGVTMCTLQVH